MDDRVVHYYVMLSELCESASLAKIPLQISTADGVYYGITRTVRTTGPDPEHGKIEIGDTPIAFREITGVSFTAPDTS